MISDSIIASIIAWSTFFDMVTLFWIMALAIWMIHCNTSLNEAVTLWKK